MLVVWCNTRGHLTPRGLALRQVFEKLLQKLSGLVKSAPLGMTLSFCSNGAKQTFKARLIKFDSFLSLTVQNTSSLKVDGFQDGCKVMRLLMTVQEIIMKSSESALSPSFITSAIRFRQKRDEVRWPCFPSFTSENQQRETSQAVTDLHKSMAVQLPSLILLLSGDML